MAGENEILKKLSGSKGNVADKLTSGMEDQDGSYRTLLNLLSKGLVSRSKAKEGNDKWIWSITNKGRKSLKTKNDSVRKYFA